MAMQHNDAVHAEAPLWITEADVVALLTLADSIDVLERALAAEHRGEVRNMAKTHVAWDGHTLHAIGAVSPETGFAGTKTWAHTAGGATPLLVLYDSRDGSLAAIVEAFALGQMRTGGISGVATRWLAANDADHLAVIGSGKQAIAQVAAVAAVRPLKSVRLFSPTPAHRAVCADRLRSLLDADVVETESVGDATRGAQIITLVTRATIPFLRAAQVEQGAHINAVGAITPDRAEFCTDVLDRCAAVVADSVAAVQALSQELGEFYGSGGRDWTAVLPLSRVVAGGRGRTPGADLTLFKAMGMGLSDLALGVEIYRRALAAGIGRRLAAVEKAAVRFGVKRDA
jgi:ornithine cyclodeaminase